MRAKLGEAYCSAIILTAAHKHSNVYAICEEPPGHTKRGGPETKRHRAVVMAFPLDNGSGDLKATGATVEWEPAENEL